MDKGVIYIVTGKPKYIRECIFSAKSLKTFCPDLPITLFTDNEGIKEKCFDTVQLIPGDTNPMKTKVRYICQSPYTKTLFLDSDTQVKGPLYELFDLLDDYDLALASFPKIDRSRIPAKLISYEHPDRYNTGVIVYKNSLACRLFFEKWMEADMLQEMSGTWLRQFCDQSHFNKLIEKGVHTECDAKIKMISNKIYNVRRPLILPLMKSGEIRHSKIIHTHYLHRNLLFRYYLLLMDRVKKEKRKKQINVFSNRSKSAL